jgi:D-methionine transport system ATP-binding protein
MDVVRNICTRVSEMRDGQLLSTQRVVDAAVGSTAEAGEADE